MTDTGAPSDALRSAVERVVAKTHDDGDVALLAQAYRDGKLVLATGEGSIAVGGGVKNSQIATGGSVQIALNGVEAAGVRDVLQSVFPASLFQLPAPVEDFVARDSEITQLEEPLRRAGRAGVAGMPGSGKSEMAKQVADRVRNDFPDAQLWIDLRGDSERPLSHVEGLAGSLRFLLGSAARLPTAVEELRSLYLSTLSRMRALLVLDGAGDDQQVRSLLPPRGCGLLVTARRLFVLEGMVTVRLGPFAPADARQLLVQIAPHLTFSQADAIGLACGYLPLALRAAGSLLRVQEDLDPDDYIQMLQDERTRLERIGSEGVTMGIEASLQLSYTNLDAACARVFRQLAVFPATFTAFAEEAVCSDADHRQLSELLRRSLVLYASKTKRYRLHDLVRVFATRRSDSAEHRAAALSHASHFRSAVLQASGLLRQGAESGRLALALFDQEWPNIQAGQRWAEANAPADRAAALLTSEYPAAAAPLLGLRAHLDEQIRWLEQGVAASRRLGERRTELTHLGNLGEAYLVAGNRPRALELLGSQLDLALDLDDEIAAAEARNSLGYARFESGDTDGALTLYTQALTTARAMGDRTLAAKALRNLGNGLGSQQRFGEAEEAMHEALELFRAEHDRRGEGHALSDLGWMYGAQQRWTQSLESLQSAVGILRELEDEDGEGRALANLGLVYSNQGRSDEALATWHAALGKLDPGSPDLLALADLVRQLESRVGGFDGQ